MTAQIVLIAYGLFLILGGFMGLKKGSKISLIMGVSSGLMVFIGLWAMSFAPINAWKFLSCLNILLTFAFISRYIKTRSFMPSGMLLMVSMAVLIFCLFHMYHA